MQQACRLQEFWCGDALCPDGTFIIFAGLNNPLLAGNVCSIFASGLMLVMVTYISPAKTPFDWEDFKTKISTSDDKVRKT